MDRSENMRRIKGRDTKPELIVRRMVHAMGYRYRLHSPDLPGKPDLVFRSRRKVIFIHGCFWHVHGCETDHVPRSNLGYWKPKLARNRARDKKIKTVLARAAWRYLIVWECQTRKESSLSARVRRFLGTGKRRVF